MKSAREVAASVRSRLLWDGIYDVFGGSCREKIDGFKAGTIPASTMQRGSGLRVRSLPHMLRTFQYGANH